MGGPGPASVGIQRIGKTGLAYSGQYLREEWHPDLRGTKWLRVAREMRDNDITAVVSIRAISALLRGVRWHAEKAEVEEAEDERADAEAEFLETVFDDMDTGWRKVVGTSVDNGMTFGFCPTEIVHKFRRGPDEEDPSFRSAYRDGRVGLRDLAFRAPESSDGWEFDKADDVVLGWYQRATSSGWQRVFIPRQKLWLYRPEDPKGSPEGRALLRHCYRPYFKQKHLEDMEAVGIQRDFVGIPTARVPLDYFGTTDSAKQAVFNDIVDSLTHMSANELTALIYPHSKDPATEKESGFDISLMTSGGRRTIDLGPAIDRYAKQKAMVFLTQFLFLGMDKVGSYSLSSDLTSLFASTLGAILDDMQESINAEVVWPLYELNGVPVHLRATWTHGDIEKEDLKAFAETLLALTTGGHLTPDSTLEDFLRRKMELPEAEDNSLAPLPDVTVGDGEVPTGVGATADATVQDTALNGAQIEALIGTLESAASGTLPKDTVRAILVSSFPSVSSQRIDEMLAPIVPRVQPEVPGAAPAQPQA